MKLIWVKEFRWEFKSRRQFLIWVALDFSQFLFGLRYASDRIADVLYINLGFFWLAFGHRKIHYRIIFSSIDSSDAGCNCLDPDCTVALTQGATA